SCAVPPAPGAGAAAWCLEEGSDGVGEAAGSDRLTLMARRVVGPNLFGRSCKGRTSSALRRRVDAGYGVVKAGQVRSCAVPPAPGAVVAAWCLEEGGEGVGEASGSDRLTL